MFSAVPSSCASLFQYYLNSLSYHSARGKAALTSSDRYVREERGVHWAVSAGVGSCQHLFSFTCKPQQAPTRPRGGHSITPRARWEIWLSETNGAFFGNMVTGMHT